MFTGIPSTHTSVGFSPEKIWLTRLDINVLPEDEVWRIFCLERFCFVLMSVSVCEMLQSKISL
jgi:hypothetical protein